jgi:guanosine-3',5'-bis(diphosphate) 3'-pyrophosphohydrolase
MSIRTERMGAMGAEQAEPAPLPAPAPAPVAETPPRTKPRRKLMRQTELVDRVKAYDPDADEALLNKAYVFAMKAHGQQFRASGDPYFAHPLEVAGILTELKLDVPTIATALLHDTIEDTAVTYDDVKQNFGEEIAGLVDGVTKLSKLELFSERTRQAENFRKLMLAMSNDIRVLLVKLADRLHNMRTLGFIKSADKRRRIAQETVDIYAPLAGRIGMQRVREELEDLTFAELNPEARNSIVTRLSRLDAQSGDRVGRIADQLKRKLAEHGIDAWVYGRAKRPYSIWRKLKDKQLNFESLSDIFGFRVIVKSEEDCYRALGVLHTSWRMIPERFKDFISNPKTNGYRSIHSTVIGPEQQRVEVQIRTDQMHDIAERGVAAHWRYREHVDESAAAERAFEWLRDMVDLLEKGDSVEEFLEHSRLHLYQDQVFCFTPKGDLISLPRGATPIDFAYAVHTDLGNTTVGAKINGIHAALHTPLKNGDQVDIIRTKEQTPSPLWEKFVVTGRARAEIRRYLRHARRDEHANLGRKVLEKVFADEGVALTDKAIGEVARKLQLPKPEDVFAQVGRGALRADDVLMAVYPEIKRKARQKADGWRDAEQAISIHGLTEGVSYRLGQCCHPLPGDRIVGLMVPGEGVVVHTIDCEELEQAQSSMADWLDVKWDTRVAQSATSVARVLVRVRNAPGSLAAAIGVIGSNGGNIFNLKVVNRTLLLFEFMVDIEVRDVAHLQNILGALRVNAAVESVDRVRGPQAGPEGGG